MLRLEGVSKSYGSVAALRPTDLTAATKKITVLLGPSGCGKTTLLRLMIGLLRPDSGSVSFGGLLLRPDNIREIRLRTGYVVQDGGLFPHLTARENVELVARHLRWAAPRIEARTAELAQLVRLTPDTLERYPVELSGGQRQRVALMRALMLDPELLLLDEPAFMLPLGVVAAKRPIIGQILLAIVGVLQTIPSLALLVLMIPLLGIGALPAVTAMFLYSLLPIARNTVAGLTDIPPSLRASAEALGLPPGAQLRLIELPIASRSILAGIKTSAVLNVGTATLGALIGAGGYGQPILTGIRLDDASQILEGAIPAAVLALLVQGFFELIERWVVPRGLRLKPPKQARY